LVLVSWGTSEYPMIIISVRVGADISSRLDTTVYDEALDDFGTNPDDFM
jgi:hypothetical protein